MDETDIKSKIFYYFQNKHFNLMLNACKEGMTTFRNDISFQLYHSLSLMLINRLEEAMHDLESIKQESDVKLAATIALMYAHKMLGISSKELFSKLDAKMKEYRKTADAVDFYHSSFVLVTLNKLDKALDYVEKSLVMQSRTAEFLTLKGIILLMLKKTTKIANVKENFQTSLQLNPKYLSTIIGYTECFLHSGDFTEALNCINKAVVRYPNTLLPLLQKMKIHFASLDWDQTIETINRINSIDHKNLECLKYNILLVLVKSTNALEAKDTLEKYLDMLEVTEPNNTDLFLESSMLFSRVCNRNRDILKITVKMLESVLGNDSENVKVIVELGYQMLLVGKTKDSQRYFKSVTKIDESCFEALLGLSLCEFAENGNTDQLKRQVQYLLELEAAENSEKLYLLRARTSDTSDESLVHLKRICDMKKSQLKLYFYSDKYLLALDPDFVLDVVREYMIHTFEKGHVSTENVLELLNFVTKACPGQTETTYLLARLQYMKGDTNAALNTLEKLLLNQETVASNTEGLLLMAQIQVQTHQYQRAAQSLESCISTNFKVRENPLYHYVSALVEKNSDNFADAIKSLTAALSLAGNRNKPSKITLKEKSEVYIELIDVLNIVGQQDEASKILEDATEDLKNTHEETRLLLISAENLVVWKNIQGAIELLEKIQPTDGFYREAKVKIAEILLKYRRDNFAFLQIYQDFVEENPGSESYVMLGDAYMTVLEPDDALECYEKALKEKPEDAALVSKMGKALVETHYFARAVEYYKLAIKNTDDAELKLNLAELYLNLKEYEKGELILLNELEKENSSNANMEDLTYLKYKSKLLSLLAQIQEKSGNLTYAMKSLKEAMENQNRVRKRLTVEQNVVPESEIKTLLDFSIKLGEMAIAQKSNDQAIAFYKEGLEVSPQNITILVALAKLYMNIGYLDLCQQTCASIFRIDPENETASVMMADIAFRKVDFDMALFHFTQLITKQPTNWEALVRLIEISRRTGNIEECSEYLNSAEKRCSIPSKETGFLYCTGLYQWHSGNLNGALRSFNQARQDIDLGQKAICNMIEICLNPDEDMFSEQLVDSDDIEYKDSRSMALKTADRLLKELKQKLEASGEDLLKWRLLTNFRLLATKEKFSVERALEDFIQIASQNSSKENIGATLGMSSAYIFLKQTQRAKNQLKRIVKTTWNFEDAEYLERCWLLLADFYVQSAKYDVASDLINKVVQHNKACTKAHEYLGFIAEKDQRFKDAANHYQSAWKFGGKSNPGIGFKLAYCLMKCKKYPYAIDTAQEVLKISPEYPKVRKEILDKCMNNLRI